MIRIRPRRISGKEIYGFNRPDYGKPQEIGAVAVMDFGSDELEELNDFGIEKEEE